MLNYYINNNYKHIVHNGFNYLKNIELYVKNLNYPTIPNIPYFYLLFSYLLVN